MAESSWPYDAGPGMTVTELRWGQMAEHWVRSGVLVGIDNELEVFADATGRQVKVNTGQAFIKGQFYVNDAIKLLPIAAAHATLPRIDLVVLENNWTTDGATTVVVTGTAAASPVEPALTQSASRWQEPLGRVWVNPGATIINAADVRDKRKFSGNFDHPATVVIAASNTNGPGRASADFTCDGVSDQIDINNALNLAASLGGRALLMEGTYTIDNQILVPSNVSLEGLGPGSIIKIKNSTNISINCFTNISGSAGNTGIRLANFKIDGNSANQTAGIQRGVYFKNCNRTEVRQLLISNTRGRGITFLENSALCSIFDNVIENTTNTSDGISLDTATRTLVLGNIVDTASGLGIGLISCQRVQVTGNIVSSSIQDGIYLTACSECSITGNTVTGSGADGIKLFASCRENTITGNVVSLTWFSGIVLDEGSINTTVIGNVIYRSSQELDNVHSGILIRINSDANNIQGNTIRRGDVAPKAKFGIYISDAGCDGNMVTGNDCYQAGQLASFQNGGTGTNTSLDANGNHIGG